MEIEKLLQEILEQFPNGNIINISSLKKYPEIKRLASTKNMSTYEFLTDLGFKVSKKNMIGESQALEQLSKHFPDGKVYSLTQNHPKINYALKKAAANQNLSLNEYMKECGFQLIRKPKNLFALPLEKVVLEKEKYIGKTKYDELLMKDLIDNYKFIASDFSELLGVSKQAITSKLKRVKRNSFDWQLKELPTEHIKKFLFMIEEEIAKFETETHRYYISYNPTKRSFAFTVFPFNTNEFPMCIKDEVISAELLKLMFQKEYHIFNTRDFFVLQELRNSHPDTYNNTSGNLYNSFRSLANKHISYLSSNEKENFDEKYPDFNGRYATFAQLKQLAYSKEDGRKISDEEITNALQSFYNPESRTVKIPIKSNQYQRLVNLAKNRGFNLKQFIELYGFKYKRFREDYGHMGEKRKQKILHRLENYKVQDDTVYISSYSKFYAHLTNAGRNKNMTLTEYLQNEFNLNRMEFHDLPEGFTPYELGDSEEDLIKEEKFLHYIEVNLIINSEMDTFYINSASKFYNYLLRYTNLIGINVDDFFNKWDLTRLSYQEAVNELISMDFSLEEAEEFLNRITIGLDEEFEEDNNSDDEDSIGAIVIEEGKDSHIKENPNSLDSQDDEKLIEEKLVIGSDITVEEKKQESLTNEEAILKDLEELSVRVKDTLIETEKKTRSQELVKKMKGLYNFKCQLCDPSDPIPVITMIVGIEYVEMHHIIAISTSNAEDETDFILDDYKNAVVVCSHHHKVLHYHQGGFTEIDEMIDGLYFVNDETEVKIHLNKHLSLKKN